MKNDTAREAYSDLFASLLGVTCVVTGRLLFDMIKSWSNESGNVRINRDRSMS